MGLLGKAAIILNPAVSNPEAAKPDAAGIRTVLDNFQENNPSFHCVILKALPGEDAGGKDITQAAAGMVLHFGSACVLPGGNCLVLVPGDIDRELIALQLSKSINAKTLSQFSAESAAGAFKAISPYLQ